MAITLKQLCKYAGEKYDMEQVAGEESMNNMVNWVHMLEDPETAYFLHGHELIFTTGIAPHDEAWFLTFAEGLVVNRACGWVINLGPYIKEVPNSLIGYCKEKAFPLFVIPWKTRIVDITNDFCHRIIKAEETEMSVGSAFRNAIFSPNNVGAYRAVLERNGFYLDQDFGVIAITFHSSLPGDITRFEKSVRLHLNKILYVKSDKFSVFTLDQQMLVVMQDFEDLEVEGVVERLLSVANFGGGNYHIHVGYSSGVGGIDRLCKAYKRALECQRLAIRQRKKFLGYHMLGIQKLLIEIDDQGVLRDFYKETLGPLEDYDDKHSSDYCYILKCYLDNNNSVEKVAGQIYVHRNTINYKIKKIKEILETDFSYEEGLKLLLAYYIKTIL